MGGVTPGKGGSSVEGFPVFDTMTEAVRETGANVSLVFVPAAFAMDSMLEALDSGVELVICITEGVPTLDVVRVKEYMRGSDARLVGPNCPGVITPGEAKVGIMPGYIHKPGRVGIISRSGTLTYEAVWQLTNLGIGQSTCLGIGGDPVIGTTFIDALSLFENDPDTDAVVMIGEIGGSDEEEAAGVHKPELHKAHSRLYRRSHGAQREKNGSRGGHHIREFGERRRQVPGT